MRPPLGVYLAALSTRLSITCRSASGSAHAATSVGASGAGRSTIVKVFASARGRCRSTQSVIALPRVTARASRASDPDSIFDSQIKRIHEYKRQLLNALRVVVLYNRLRQDPGLDMAPRTFLFAGKAAPAYHLAKLIIKFLNNLAATIDADP